MKKKRAPRKYHARNLSEVAAFFGVALNTMERWRSRGMPGAPLKWDLSAIAQWRETRAKEQAVARAEGEDPNHPDYKLKKYRAALMRVKLEAERGRLIKLAVHLQVLREICGDFRRGVLSLANSLGGQLRGLDPTQADQAIRDRFTELLEDLSEHAGSGRKKAAAGNGSHAPAGAGS
jgi:phage terminase Nu1 subunit (DNA packaging protein)